MKDLRLYQGIWWGIDTRKEVLKMVVRTEDGQYVELSSANVVTITDK